MTDHVQLFINGAKVYETGTTPPPVGPVDPPPTNPDTPPAYNGPIHWDLGAPDTISPTDTRKNVSAGVEYAIRFIKTSDANKLRVQGPWFTYVNSSIPGFRGNYTAVAMGGYHDIPINGAPNGTLVVLFTLSAGVPSGEIAPQLIGS